MYIQQVIIKNFKKFRDFKITLNPNVNIIVGNNEEGKSTILEAIHLALSGMYGGRSLRNDLSEYFFNRDVVDEYLKSLKTENKLQLPEIYIEVYFGNVTGSDMVFSGDGNSLRNNTLSGISYKICFDDEYTSEYEKFIAGEEHNSLPIEYYKVVWSTFAREIITSRSIPIKSVIVDSSTNKYQNGSDIYISKIIKDSLDERELVALSQSYRTMKANFKADDMIRQLNQKITSAAQISERTVTVSVDMSMKNPWETTLMTFIDDVPFQHIGKGEQCLIKTNLALSHNRAETSNLILLEEPENHLSHTKLNELLLHIQNRCANKQIIISTHSNYVANKLNLSNLILLTGNNTFPFSNLNKDDADYFTKISGYDTLRMILSKATILVEGPSDELVVQKAFMMRYNALPIEKGVDVISVPGLAFKRLLSVAKELSSKRIAVVTDNDGDYETRIVKKYADFSQYDNIKICADQRNDINTLEPQFIDANKSNLDVIRAILGLEDSYTKEKLSAYMQNHKTDWALKIFNTDKKVEFPQYIKDAIDWVQNE